MKLNKRFFIALTIIVLTAAALPAHAAILPACATDVNAVLQLSCAINLLISISQFILGLTGSLALLFFVYGGFLFLTSRGSSSQVEKGRTILTQATIGIIIIFGAYLAINFLVANVLKAKFTTEIPKEATPSPTAPAQQTTAPAPAGGQKTGACICTLSTNIQNSAIYNNNPDKEAIKDNFLLGVCSALAGSYTASSDSCTINTVGDPQKCSAIKTTDSNISVSCSFK